MIKEDLVVLKFIEKALLRGPGAGQYDEVCEECFAERLADRHQQINEMTTQITSTMGKAVGDD